MKFCNSKLKEFIKVFQGKRVVIMGLGVHNGGVGVADFFGKIGAQVVVTDLKSASELEASLKKLSFYNNIRYVLGRHEKEDFIKADLIIKNPDVADNSEFLRIAKENKVPIATEIGIFFALSPAPIIGITGTKGKSTTASLVTSLLKSQVSCELAGNIRISALQLLPKLTPNHWVVLELSSWQLEGLDSVKKSPKIALITSIYPDHLNRYSSFETYLQAKKLIFKYQSCEDFLILNSDTDDLKKFAPEAKSKVFFSGRDLSCIPADKRGVSIKEGWFIWRDEKIAPLSNFKLIGEHNLQNASLAITVAKLLDIPNESIRENLKEFAPLSGRLEIVKKIKGVTFINDTTATIPQATLKSIYSLNRPIILITGGTGKNLDYTKFVQTIHNLVKAIILLPGDATEKIKEIKANILKNEGEGKEAKWYEAKDMKEAVNIAWNIAKRGDIILLSPAAASFGLFRHEFERGDIFVKYINELKF
jgi:UDP-N-acetylmuramoylalanine--D-glutamate ligase